MACQIRLTRISEELETGTAIAIVSCHQINEGVSFTVISKAAAALRSKLSDPYQTGMRFDVIPVPESILMIAKSIGHELDRRRCISDEHDVEFVRVSIEEAKYLKPDVIHPVRGELRS